MLEAQVTQEERPACERPPPRFFTFPAENLDTER